MKRSIFLLAIVLLLVSCGQGRFVDKTSPSFVDRNPAGSIDNGLPKANNTLNNTVINETNSSFVPPPSNNTSVTLAEKQMYNVSVVVWVWNSKGSSQLLVPEGMSVIAPNLGVTVTNVLIGKSDGVVKVKLLVNGAAAKNLGYHEETLVDNTWVFVQDMYANEPI